MNKVWRVVAMVLAMVMVLSATAVAEEANATLYEKYNYEEDFEYNDEIMGYALKSTVAKIYLIYDATYRYAQLSFDNAKFTNQFKAYVVEYPNMTAEDILQYMQQHLTEYLSVSEMKEKSDTAYWVGSGVVVSDDGYIATNAHVISSSQEERLSSYVAGAYKAQIRECEESLKTAINTWNLSISEDVLNQIKAYIITVLQKSFTIVSESQPKYIVAFPGVNGETAETDCIEYEAQLVTAGTAAGSGEIDGLTQDAAILKINANNLIALKLLDDYPEINTALVAAGFPVASDNVFRSVGSAEATLAVSLKDGIVSRLVPISGQKYQAIETDATISGGNSGGPSVNKNLNVIGLNTYSNADDGRYAYMISSVYIKDNFAGNANFYQDEASKTFLLGLQMMQSKDGATALECFERVKQLQPDTPYINVLIDKAGKLSNKSAPAKTGLNLKIDKKLVAIIGICVAGLVILVVAVIVIKNILKNKKKKKTTTSPLVIDEDVWGGMIDSPITDVFESDNTVGSDDLLGI